ncbi:MAG: hypothetical protein HY711_04415 [Candidatus Melainabacteria bacterium]|nr:hypothetical protein [Candidatus Melainabacteria bacterium]
MTSIILASVLIVVGLSFTYKAVLAIFWGRTVYWHGFLPITLISPFLIHLPPGKNSLIKTAQCWWVHVILGPIFFFVAMALLVTGTDTLGLPGAETVNYIMTFGRTNVPAAIVYDKHTGYKFPIVGRAGKTIFKLLTNPVPEKEEDKMVPQGAR